MWDLFRKLGPPRTRDTSSEEMELKSESDPLVDDNSPILENYHMFDVSKDKKFMAVLTKGWRLVVYTLKHTNDGIEYVEELIRYKVKKIDGVQNHYMYLSVASKTGDVAISFAELEVQNIPLFTTKTPQQDCRYCLVYSKKSTVDKSRANGPKKIEFQGRAVYVKDKLVLIGEKILEVRYADTLRLKYFLDLEDLEWGYEALLAGESFAKQATWAKYFPTRPPETNNDRYTTTGPNDAENTTRMINDGDKLILMTQHIHSNILVTNYRGNIFRVWSILDGSLLVSLATKETEYVMAISGDQRFVATYEETKKEVNVYCTKSNLLLHTYLPQEKQTDRSNFSVTCVRFYSYRPYIVIAGTRKEQEVTRTGQNKFTAFYEVWSIYQERLIQSEEEPDVCTRALQPFALEWITDYGEQNGETQDDSQSSSSGEQNSESGRSESVSSSSQTVSENSNSASGSNATSPNLQSTIIASGSNTPRLTTESNSIASISNTPQLAAEINNTNSGSNNSTESNNEYPPLYGVFSKKIGSNIAFRKKLVFKYSRPPRESNFELVDEIDWDGFHFQKLGGIVYIRKPLSDICEPLDGENTLGYISDHESGVYLLRFGTHMVQLWKLAKIPEEEEVNAETAGHIFNFRNVSRSSEGKYFNTIQHSHLEFTRAYKGYHNDDLSSFRDVWNSYGSNIHFMSDEGHIIVDIKKFPMPNNFTYRDQKTNILFQRNLSWLKKIDGKIWDFFSENSKKPRQETIITEDEFFLPLSRDGSSETVYEFCEIESAFQALRHLDYATYSSTNKDYRKDVFQANKEYLYKKISIIINKALESPKCGRYFLTVSGSRTLAMLASFKNGQDILFKTFLQKNMPVNIFSYYTPEKTKENALTVLILEKKYELFKLLFNKVLLDYHNEERKDLFPLMDALFYLQKEDLPDLLLSCIKKLSHLPVIREQRLLINDKLARGATDSYLDNFTASQYISKYHPRDKLMLYFKNATWDSEPMKLARILMKMQEHESWEKKSRNFHICIAPFPGSDIYGVLSYVSGVDDDILLRTGSVDHESNSFTEDYPLIDVLIDYRWRTSAKLKFYIISVIHLLHYAFYSVSVSFPEEAFFYIPGEKVSHPGHKASIAFMLICDLLIFWQEVLQMKAFGFSYFKSFYNYIDLAACVFPVASLTILINNSSYLYEFSSITTLILWMHFLLRLRILRSIGNLVQIIIELGKRTFPVFVTMVVVVLAFTNSFIVLLRRQDDSFFQEQYGGNSTSAGGNGLIGISNVTTSDQSQQNLFTDIFLAFTSVWLFIYGEFDPVLSGNAGNYPMAIILLVLFTFVTSLIILNVVIAVMTGAIDATTKRGNKNWYSHFAAVVAEIELFLRSFSKKDEPMFIYYYSRKEVAEIQKSKIKEEYERLKKKYLDSVNDITE